MNEFFEFQNCWREMIDLEREWDSWDVRISVIRDGFQIVWYDKYLHHPHKILITAVHVHTSRIFILNAKKVNLLKTATFPLYLNSIFVQIVGFIGLISWQKRMTGWYGNDKWWK